MKIEIPFEIKNKLDFGIINKIHSVGGKCFLVGGVVRDIIMNRDYNDIDICIEKITKECADELFGVCKNNFGVYNIEGIDFCLARKEISTGTNYKDFSVEFGQEITIYEDLKRRDFTINAMALNLKTEMLIDPFGGYKDIENKKLHPVAKVEDDPVRILRAIRFVSNFTGFVFTSDLFNSIKDNVHVLENIQLYHKRNEFEGILSGTNVRVAFSYMLKTGVLSILCRPFFNLHSVPYNYIYHYQNACLHTIESISTMNKFSGMYNKKLAFALLLHDTGKVKYAIGDDGIVHNHGHNILSYEIARKYLYEMGYDNEFINDVCGIIENHMIDVKNIYLCKKIARRIGLENFGLLLYHIFLDQITSNRPGVEDDIKYCMNEVSKYMMSLLVPTVKDLDINGYELMELGYIGVEIGKIQKIILEEILNDRLKNEKMYIFEFLRSMK